MDWDVYGAEAGPFAIEDTDGVFLVAALAVPRTASLANVPPERVGARRVVALLKEIRVYPQCVYVKPFPAYAAALVRGCALRSSTARSTS